MCNSQISIANDHPKQEPPRTIGLKKRGLLLEIIEQYEGEAISRRKFVQKSVHSWGWGPQLLCWLPVLYRLRRPPLPQKV